MLAVSLLALAAAAGATPVQQVVFGSADSLISVNDLPKIPHHKFNPLDHMSGIAPYHDAPNADVSPPPQCTVAAAAFLVRHSSIYANDDEYADYMEPFISRVYSAQERGVPVLDQSPLKFLKDWHSLVNETNLEDITPSGKDDARELGRRFRKLYGDLMPPEHLGKRKGDLSSWLKSGKKGKKGGKKHKKGDKVKTPFKVWSASSERDVETSKSFVQGAFPHWQAGHGNGGGEGDGKYIQLVAVKNKDPDWAHSLTPHKICDAFTKESGKPHAQQWLETWGPAVLDRLNAHAPGWNFELNDVIAMFMLCGYETVISGAKTPSSPFCSADLFSPEEFRAFGYHQDLLYHYMVGYGAPTAPYLGVQWLNISTHNLLAAYAPDPHPNMTMPTSPSLVSRLSSFVTGSKPKLPPPSNPPDATHTQLLYVYFTHREEPPVALTALGLWNTSTEDLPDTMSPKDRLWKTSHLLPFLGHVAIERLHCEADEDQLVPASSSSSSSLWRTFLPSFGNDDGKDRPRPTHSRKDYVRVLVNGAPQPLPSCHDGPGGTCRLADFEKFVRQRTDEFSDFEGACKKDEE
ncbi:hypothetical protein JCM8208_002988 [Rhodotorula glutinis]